MGPYRLQLHMNLKHIGFSYCAELDFSRCCPSNGIANFCGGTSKLGLSVILFVESNGGIENQRTGVEAVYVHPV